MTEPDWVRLLKARLDELDAAFGVERTRLADALIPEVHERLLLEGDRGVWQATRPGNGTRKQAAERLGTTVPYVQKRASRYSRQRRSR